MELHFGCSFQGYSTRPYLMCLNTRAKYCIYFILPYQHISVITLTNPTIQFDIIKERFHDFWRGCMNSTELHLAEVMYQQGKVIIGLGSDKNICIHILLHHVNIIKIDYHNVHKHIWNICTNSSRLHVVLRFH